MLAVGGVLIGIYNADAVVSIGTDVCIGANFIIDCQKSITIGENTMFGPNVFITDHDHDYSSENWRDEYKSEDVVIGNNVWVGANVTILKGTKIGDNSVIGAGSILKGEYKPNCIYYTDRKMVEKEILPRQMENVK